MEEKKDAIFEGLNSAQASAVENIEGPCLIIAGAGSGKTRVLTCRIANLIVHGVKPEEILALTFTNKAAAEMRGRIAAAVGKSLTYKLLAGTFHSIFIKFLRQEHELTGFPQEFTIYDTSDSRALIKACIKELQLDDKIYKPADVQSRISKAKNNLVTCQAYASNTTAIENDKASRKPLLHRIYTLYSLKCRQNGAMDFDDILLYTNILFREHPDALDRIASRFRYILVDEYQDTNLAQYIIVKKLASKHRNIAVVGDDSQSIYAFRGARIENILNFRKDYPECKEYRLEQNYRSTKTIVNAANSVIACNRNQIRKECFSKGSEGDLIELINAFTDKEEGYMVAASISSSIYRTKDPYSSYAVLYRTNAQSRIIEEELRRHNMPYRIYAGHSFYERAEVKDFMAYIKLIVNPRDDESFKRIINFPTRGIGDTTVARLVEAAKAAGGSIMEFIFRNLANSNAAQQSTAQQSAAQQGAAQQGSGQQDAEQQSAAQQGAGQQGAARQSTAQQSTAQQSAGQQGSAQQGTAQQSAAQQAAAQDIGNLSVESALLQAGIRDATTRKIALFAKKVVELRSQLLNQDAFQIASLIDTSFGISSSLMAEKTIEAQSRLENIEELLNSIAEFVENGENENAELAAEGLDPVLVTLDMYLQNVSLISDLDVETGEDDNRISLMTVHSSKGLEFDHVYVIGMEENLFPSPGAVSMLSYADNTQLEEERRLFYVAITRAKKDVKLSFAHQRKKFGETVSNKPSRFIKEIDSRYISNPLHNWEQELTTPGLSARDGSYFSRGMYGGSNFSGSRYGGNNAGSGSNFSGSRYGGNNAGSGIYSNSSYGDARSGQAGGKNSFNWKGSLQTAPKPQQRYASDQQRTSPMSPGTSTTNLRHPTSGNLTQRPGQQPTQKIPANFMADSPAKIQVGQRVEHPRFGAGEVLSLEGDIIGRKAQVAFDDGTTRTLVLAYAKLRIL